MTRPEVNIVDADVNTGALQSRTRQTCARLAAGVDYARA